MEKTKTVVVVVAALNLFLNSYFQSECFHISFASHSDMQLFLFSIRINNQNNVVPLLHVCLLFFIVYYVSVACDYI